MDISANLRNQYNKAVKNDGKIDAKEFESLKKEILSDKVVDKAEKDFLSEKISEGNFDKGAIPAVTELFSDKYKDENQSLKDIFEISLGNDGKIDSKELEFIKKELFADNKISPSEKDFLTDKLSEGKFKKETVQTVISFISDEDDEKIIASQDNSESDKTETQTQTKPEENKEKTNTPETKEQKAEEKKDELKAESKPEEKKDDPNKGKIDHKMSIRGGINSTTVSDGWSQYGKEQTATKVEGAFEGEINYSKGKLKINNKLLLEYGNIATKDGKSTTKDNQELTSEFTYQVLKKDDLSIEIPYGKLYTKGPLTELGNRKFRESTGVKMVYDNKELKGKYSLNLGGGLQQTHDPEKQAWNSQPGLELLFEAKQRLGFLSKTYSEISKTSEDNYDFFDKVELNGGVNMFVPLDHGFKSSTMDITVDAGAKLYLNKTESVWLGASKQWRHGGQENSSWESRFVTDIGFKF